MQQLRVLQLIDSLSAAGKERVAVNVANLLQGKGIHSCLCSTRREGPLLEEVGGNVARICLARKRTLELGAFRKLLAFIRENQINIIHAHGDSLFLAGLASMFWPYPVILWHDHHGNQEQEERPSWLYRLGTARVSGVITVTQALANWSMKRLHISAERIWYLPNFAANGNLESTAPKLPGEPGWRIVCTAGIRPQKDHKTLLRAMALVSKSAPKAHLLIVGTTKDQKYLDSVRREIAQLGLNQQVSLLGERQDVQPILKACTLGVLSSASEGFPLALLEYGMAGLPVVATNVGQCSEILGHGRAGILVPPGSPHPLAEALIKLLKSSSQAKELGAQLEKRIKDDFSPDQIIEKVIQIYENILKAPNIKKDSKVSYRISNAKGLAP